MRKKITALCASLLVGLFSENGICMRGIEPLKEESAQTFIRYRHAGESVEHALEKMFVVHPDISFYMFDLDGWMKLSGMNKRLGGFNIPAWSNFLIRLLSSADFFSRRIENWAEKNQTKEICLVLGDDGLNRRSRFMNDFCVYWDKNIFDIPI
jgi:hypothetical protein